MLADKGKSMKRAVKEDDFKGMTTRTVKTVAESVYNRLRDDIVWGHLTPSSPLRSDELRERYKVGVSPLREALTRLTSERLVVAIGQRGFTVAPLTSDDVQDTKDTRLLVEREALTRSIKLGGIAWETGLVAAFHALSRVPIPRRPGPAWRSWAPMHRQFHMALISACGSRWQLEFAAQLFDQAERHRTLRARVNQEFALKRDIASEHRKIFDAAMARDIRAAVRALERHYENTADQVLSAISRKPKVVQRR